MKHHLPGYTATLNRCWTVDNVNKLYSTLAIAVMIVNPVFYRHCRPSRRFLIFFFLFRKLTVFLGTCLLGSERFLKAAKMMFEWKPHMALLSSAPQVLSLDSRLEVEALKTSRHGSEAITLFQVPNEAN